MWKLLLLLVLLFYEAQLVAKTCKMGIDSSESCNITIVNAPIITFDQLSKKVIRCAISTKYPGTLSLQIDSLSNMFSYQVRPLPRLIALEEKKFSSLFQLVDIIIIGALPRGVHEAKIVYEYEQRKDTTRTQIKVLSTAIELPSCHRYSPQIFGQPYQLNRRFGRVIKKIPNGSLFIKLQVGSRKPITYPFEEGFQGPVIPTDAKKIKTSILWQHPITEERIDLYVYEEVPIESK